MLPHRSAAILLCFACSFALAQPDPWSSAERKPGLVAAISSKLNEEAWFVPGGPGADGKPVMLKARVVRPAGDGPFKAAVISHGSPASSSGRPTMAVPRYSSPTAWLVERGYMVVMPLRRGYGDNTRWMEDYGSCNGADYVSAGNGTADDIVAVARYVGALPMARRDRILLVGVSAGGFGSIAAARRNPEGVFAVLNFSGGRGGHQGRYGDGNCAPGNLVKAAGVFGSGARIPSLWVYARNDTFFQPELSKRMAEAYKAAGGNVEYVLLPEFKKEGHNIFGDPDGRASWADRVADFLQKLE